MEWGAGGPALRLGMRLVKGLRREDADAIAGAVEQHGPFTTIEHLWRASGATVGGLRRLARADAFGSMGLDRQRALWDVRSLRDERLELFEAVAYEKETRSVCEREASEPSPAAGSDSASGEETVVLPAIPARARVSHDYEATGVSLKGHPVSFIRAELAQRGVITAAELAHEQRSPGGRPVAVGGIVLVRQRPMTASGIVFMTIEDETGVSNLIVRPRVYERFRRVARHSAALLARGRVERAHSVVHVMVESFESLDDQLDRLPTRSRDFH